MDATLAKMGRMIGKPAAKPFSDENAKLMPRRSDVTVL
jgi:hypothetical protein